MLGKLGTALLILLLATTSARASQALFPAGSEAGLVPPPGMSLATQFSGFQDAKGSAAIVIAVLPAAAYKDVVAGHADDVRLGRQGITAEKRETLTVGGHPATLITGRQRSGGDSVRKWILIVGAPAGTALVTAQYHDSVAAAFPDGAIRAALTSVVFRAPLSAAEKFAALPFTIAPVRRFRVVKVLAGSSVVLTDGPKDEDPEHAQASFIVATAGSPPAAAQRASFARDHFHGLEAFRGLLIDRGKETVLGGLPAYEIIGSGFSPSAVPLRVVMWVIFGDQGTVMALGSARKEAFEAVFPQFVELRDGVRPK